MTAYREALRREPANGFRCLGGNPEWSGQRPWDIRDAGECERRLEETVFAYREALKEYTRELVPLLWAANQNGLGATVQAMGERESGTARLEEARRAFLLARDVYREAGMDRYDSSSKIG